MVLKSKYSVDEQLKNLEDKNVQFNIISKEEAREYLQCNTYYFKLKSYEKSFEYNVSKNQYINLEFAYLVELAKHGYVFKRADYQDIITYRTFFKG